jgi:glycerol-1-phosphate dehydrogenase [NAD(P)+]
MEVRTMHFVTEKYKEFANTVLIPNSGNPVLEWFSEERKNLIDKIINEGKNFSDAEWLELINKKDDVIMQAIFDCPDVPEHILINAIKTSDIPAIKAELLKTKQCDCGMEHCCDIKEVIIESGAISKIGVLLNEYNNIVLVADKNTYAVCGEAVLKQLGDKAETVHVFNCDGFLIPNEDAIDELNSRLTEKTDLIIGIGSGVIQDLCKYVSFNKKLPYFIVATAPSMDGYASKGAAMIIGNMKVTYNAHVPEAIIADTVILKDAPMDMIKSGYGDIIGKFSCLNDWKLSHVINDEYLCEYVYNLTHEMLDRTKDLGQQLLKHDEAAIKTLMEALVGVGIAMAYVGNSRPASGSEHHLSHFFEIVGISNDEPYFMHGTDVAYSAVYTRKIREELLKIEYPAKGRELSLRQWENEIRRVYGKVADGVIELQNKIKMYDKQDIGVCREKWDEIRAVLREAPSLDMMKKYLESVELDISEFEKLYGKEKIENAILYAKDLKDRYTVLWLYYLLTM